MNANEKKPLEDFELISEYSRRQAIEDGVLIDVSAVAKVAGFRYPVAITRALFTDVEQRTFYTDSRETGSRLWDVLWIGYRAFRASTESSDTLYYEVIMVVSDQSGLYKVKLVCSPGDDGEPVITLMRPDED